MLYNDSNVTFRELTDDVLRLCRAKSWGIDGRQNPQHVTAAMTVEVLELLEHFQNCDDAVFASDEAKTDTLEEAADVMNYFIQAMYVIGFDAVRMIDDSFSIEDTSIIEIRNHVGMPDIAVHMQALKLAAVSRFALEEFNWLDADAVNELFCRRAPVKAERIGRAFALLLVELLRLINMLGGDVTTIVRRKLEIVYKRKYPDNEPKR